MHDDVSVTGSELKQRIRALISQSERLFLKFAETFPVFVREMNRSLEHSSEKLARLGGGAGVEDSLHELFDTTRALIRDASSQFRDMHERDQSLLSSLNSGIEILGALDSIIVRIKEDSVEMELISLNAMTVALKSGTAGKAFSVITDELKRLSSRTISLTDQLTGDGKKLLSIFRSYREEVERLERLQAELFGGLENRLQSSFSELENDIGQIGVKMADLVSRSRKIEAPVRKIMETVQMQDIVRQSLDHVLMALEEIDSVSASSADDLAFRSQLSELAVAMTRDVRRHIAEALGTFGSSAAAVSEIVEDGERRRRELLEAGSGAGDAGGALASFGNVSETLETLAGQVDSYMRTKDSLASNGGLLTDAVEALESGFRDFSKILSRFKNIDVASRIEVAKQESLRSMSDTVLEMSALTERIGSDVDEATKSTQGFISDTKAAIYSYASLAEKESSAIRQSETSLREARDGLSGIKDSLWESVRDFSLFSKEFISIVASSSRDTDAFAQLLVELDAAIAELEGFKLSTDEMLKDLGEVVAIDTSHSARFKDVIDRFTIYAHKQVAADLGGFRVESGGELGEVTLF